jgi:hypothetical protein
LRPSLHIRHLSAAAVLAGLCAAAPTHADALPAIAGTWVYAGSQAEQDEADRAIEDLAQQAEVRSQAYGRSVALSRPQGRRPSDFAGRGRGLGATIPYGGASEAPSITIPGLIEIEASADHAAIGSDCHFAWTGPTDGSVALFASPNGAPVRLSRYWTDGGLVEVAQETGPGGRTTTTTYLAMPDGQRLLVRLRIADPGSPAVAFDLTFRRQATP